ncbi:MAG: hypothetical protein V4654_06020 [Bdellovibrionota bacterium]
MTKIIFAFVAALCLNQAAHATSSVLVTSITEQESVTTADTGSHWFGRVMVQSRNLARFTITNTGDEALDFVDASIWGMFFDAYHNCNRTLLPKEKCRFDIVYWPSFEGHHSGEFLMNFKQDSVRIHVWGDAVRRF